LNGGRGNDQLCGGFGDDELLGFGGNDVLFGEQGIDVLDGGSGVNELDEDGPGPCNMMLLPGLVSVFTEVAFPRNQTRDTNGNGIVDPGDQFELDMLVTAGSDGATNVSVGQFFEVLGPGGLVGGVGGNFGNLAPNETIRTLPNSSDACIPVLGNAVPGDEIFVEFNVTSNGETARFRAGPFVVGQITGGQTVQAVRIAN